MPTNIRMIFSHGVTSHCCTPGTVGRVAIPVGSFPLDDIMSENLKTPIWVFLIIYIDFGELSPLGDWLQLLFGGWLNSIRWIKLPRQSPARIQ